MAASDVGKRIPIHAGKSVGDMVVICQILALVQVWQCLENLMHSDLLNAHPAILDILRVFNNIDSHPLISGCTKRKLALAKS